jgi:hypothetical protein
MTDELNLCGGIGEEFKGGRKTVNHSKGEYAEGDTHVDSGESFFALLERGVHGTFQHVLKQHLPRYCGEFSFRWDHRGGNDGQRTVEAIKGAGGKRLVYRGGVGGDGG